MSILLKITSSWTLRHACSVTRRLAKLERDGWKKEEKKREGRKDLPIVPATRWQGSKEEERKEEKKQRHKDTRQSHQDSSSRTTNSEAAAEEDHQQLLELMENWPSPVLDQRQTHRIERWARPAVAPFRPWSSASAPVWEEPACATGRWPDTWPAPTGSGPAHRRWQRSRCRPLSRRWRRFDLHPDLMRRTSHF